MTWRGLLRRLVSPKLLRRLQDFLTGLVEDQQKSFITLLERPAYAAGVGTRSDPFAPDAEVAIVVQGPLVLQNHFTLNSVLLYRQHYPAAEIILSTWRGESPEELRSIEGGGARVVLSDTPAFAGISNINYQIVSARAGIAAARASGKGYVLKTRTDQRIYAPSSLEFLRHLTRSFPVTGNWSQRQRIVGHSLGTLKYRLYGISDMFLFGTAEDLFQYWQCPLDERRLQDLPREENILEHSLLRLCEVYLASEYLRRLGRELRWTLADSYAAYADHFVVANSADFDLYWSKYGRAQLKWVSYELAAGYQQLDFREWLNIYSRRDRHSPGLDAG